jgi:hypothetical protein
METLKEIIKKHAVTETPDPNTVARNLDSLHLTAPYQCEVEPYNEVMGRLTGRFFQDFFRFHLSKKYQPISDEIFSLEREVQLTQEKIEVAHYVRHHEIKRLDAAIIPLFAVIDYGSKAWSYEGKVKGEFASESEEFEANFKASASAPMLTNKVKAEAAKAMAYAYEMCAKTLRTPDALRHICFYTKNNETPEHKIIEIANPHLKVLWKPSLEALKFEVKVPEPPDRDPALLLCFNNAHYLVTTWDIPGEEPFRHYLKEFTTGTINKKIPA